MIKDRSRSRFCILLILLGLAARPCHAGSKVPVILDVLIINDPTLPKLRLTEASQMLASTREMLGEKLGFDAFEFRLREGPTLSEFMERNAPMAGECEKSLQRVSVSGGVHNPRAVNMPRDSVEKFLGGWPLRSLAQWFKSEAHPPTTYEEAASKILAAMDRNVAVIRAIRLPGGEPLLGNARLHVYTRWICAMDSQNEADVVLTNSFVMHDLGTSPAPHSILTTNTVSGASLRSPKRSALDGRAVFASTFAMATPLDMFRQDKVLDPRSNEFCRVFATSLLAHELGHAFFKIPDFYDHPPECLMSTGHNFSYAANDAQMRMHKGPCPKCRPYLSAWEFRRTALDLTTAGDRRGAIAAYRQSIAILPHFVDGLYDSQVAPLYFALAELYYEEGAYQDSARALAEAAKGGISPGWISLKEKVLSAAKARVAPAPI